MQAFHLIHKEERRLGRCIGLNGLVSWKFAIVGASFPLMAPRNKEVEAIAIPPQAREGLLAIVASYRDNRRDTMYHGFLLAVEDDINLKDPWLPYPDRPCQLYAEQHGHLEVEIEGELFTTLDPGWWNHAGSKTDKTRHLVDGDTLCQYLVRKIDEDAVRAAATAHEEEMQTRERLPELEQRLARAKQELAACQSNLCSVHAELDSTRLACHTAGLKLKDITEATTELLAEARKRWRKSRAFSAAIRNAEEKISQNA